MSAALDELDRHIEGLEGQLEAARQARDLVAGLPGLSAGLRIPKLLREKKKTGKKPARRVSNARRPTQAKGARKSKPRGTSAKSAARTTEAFKLIEAGQSAAEIAAALGVTTQRVYQYRSDHKLRGGKAA
jgi:DNA-binding NarL/FixJ family response regulator